MYISVCSTPRKCINDYANIQIGVYNHYAQEFQSKQTILHNVHATVNPRYRRHLTFVKETTRTYSYKKKYIVVIIIIIITIIIIIIIMIIIIIIIIIMMDDNDNDNDNNINNNINNNNSIFYFF